METIEQFEESLEHMPLLDKLKVAAFADKKAACVHGLLEFDLCDHYGVLMRNNGHMSYSWDRFEVDQELECVRFFKEVNVACHCHPEMETQEFLLFFDDLALTPEQFDKVLTQRKEAEKVQAAKEKERLAQQKAEQKRIDDEKARIAKLEQERKTYEDLKKKFEK
jgi:hypothetical protein